MPQRHLPVHLRLIRRALPYRVYPMLSVFTLAGASLFTVATPKLVGYAIDTGLRIRELGGDVGTVAEGNMATVLLAAVLLIVAAAARGAFTYGQTYLSERVSQSVAYDFRNDIYDRLQRLSYAYHDDAQIGQIMSRYDSFASVLRNIDIDAQPGQMIALLGPTGSGKSTIVNLLPRFYDVTSGRITIDGQDTRDVSLDSLRNAIDIVQQDVFLFVDTIRNNIAYGRPDATEEEILEAARAARIHEFIEQRPDDYDTWVGERGTTSPVVSDSAWRSRARCCSTRAC